MPWLVWIGHGLGTAQHVSDLQVLHHQHLIALHELSGLFVVEVLALVGDLTMPTRDRFTPAFAILRTAPRTSQDLLRRSQPIGTRPRPPRIVDVLTVAGSGETDDSDIDTGLAAGR